MNGFLLVYTDSSLLVVYFLGLYLLEEAFQPGLLIAFAVEILDLLVTGDFLGEINFVARLGDYISYKLNKFK